MYIKLINAVPTEYSLEQLRIDHPQTSFPSEMPEALLAEYEMYVVQEAVPPSFLSTETIESLGFTQREDGKWEKQWLVRPLNEQEIVALEEAKDEQRRQAYQQEADPLFFKWQRGEATQQQWLDKIAEIKL